MGTIFISYRRNDSADQAGRIFDRLVASFSKQRVFKDVDSVPAGADFRRIIEQAVRKADVFILIIGPAWLNATDEKGRRRLDAPDDFVRMELECAFSLGKTIIPVLVGQSSMPAASELPTTLSEVAYRNAVSVRRDPDFHRDMDRLISAVKSSFTESKRNHPRPEERAKLWWRNALVAFGVMIILGFVYFRFAPDRIAQTPKDHAVELPSSTPAVVVPQAIFNGPPSAPMKTLPGSLPQSAKSHPEIVVAQSGSRLPSAQSPMTPLEDRLPRAQTGVTPGDDLAPPTPAAPAPGSVSSPAEAQDGEVAAIKISRIKTMPMLVAQVSEDAPPPPLLSSLTGQAAHAQ